jgi:hypothetical protein
MWEKGIRPIKAMYSSLTLIMKDFHELHSLYYTVFMSVLNYFIKIII